MRNVIIVRSHENPLKVSAVGPGGAGPKLIATVAAHCQEEFRFDAAAAILIEKQPAPSE